MSAIHSLLIAAAVALGSGLATLLLPRVARLSPVPGCGTRILVGTGADAHAVPLRRPGDGALERLWRELLLLLLGEERGPVDRSLTTATIEREGIPGLRWRLLHAGRGDTTILAFRARQGLYALVLASLAALALAAAEVPVLFVIPLLPAAGALAVYASLARLRREALARRARLRIQLVTVLHRLASYVARGRSVEYALDQIGRGDGELCREIAKARELHFAGQSMPEALAVMAARCDTAQVSSAASLIVEALDGGVALKEVPGMVKRLAKTTRGTVEASRKAELEYAILRMTGIGTVIGLPIILVTILYPLLGGGDIWSQLGW